jgi:hypothetical protein
LNIKILGEFGFNDEVDERMMNFNGFVMKMMNELINFS